MAGCCKYNYQKFFNLTEPCRRSPYFSQDPFDIANLTPGHLNIGGPFLNAVAQYIADTSMSIVNRWLRMKLVYLFWRSCMNEYLKKLQQRIKWQMPEDNLEKNLMIAIKEENLPPNSWRLGRFQRLYIGSHHRLRVAEVVTQKAIFKSPTPKLVLLPFQS